MPICTQHFYIFECYAMIIPFLTIKTQLKRWYKVFSYNFINVFNYHYIEQQNETNWDYKLNKVIATVDLQEKIWL